METKKDIEPYAIATFAAKLINEDIAPGMATGSDINNAHTKLSKEADDYIAKEGWLKAFLLASSILIQGYRHFGPDKSIKDLVFTMYSLGVDIETMMFDLAKVGKLPKDK